VLYGIWYLDVVGGWTVMGRARMRMRRVYKWNRWYAPNEGDGVQRNMILGEASNVSDLICSPLARACDWAMIHSLSRHRPGLGHGAQDRKQCTRDK